MLKCKANVFFKQSQMYIPYVYVDVVTYCFYLSKTISPLMPYFGTNSLKVLTWSWVSETYWAEKKFISLKMVYDVKECIPGKQFPVIIKLKLEREPTS
jgi:hypothetical protein